MPSLRIVFWNIMAGGGRRAESITAQLLDWQADVIALAEFRATLPSLSIAVGLHAQGFEYQLTTAAEDHRSRNALLLASRYPVAPVNLNLIPEPQHRWLIAQIDAPMPFHMGVMHIPNSHTGFKYPYHDTVLSIVTEWIHGPGLFIGDTNSGMSVMDEEAPAFGPKEEYFMRGMHDCGWPDIFRHLHGEARAYTWYSPNGRNGFRLDQAFINGEMLPHVDDIAYVWGEAGQHRQLSDHAAIVLDLK